MSEYTKFFDTLCEDVDPEMISLHAFGAIFWDAKKVEIDKLRQQLAKERAEHEETKRLLVKVDYKLHEFGGDIMFSNSKNEILQKYREVTKDFREILNKIKDANKEGE